MKQIKRKQQREQEHDVTSLSQKPIKNKVLCFPLTLV